MDYSKLYYTILFCAWVLYNTILWYRTGLQSTEEHLSLDSFYEGTGAGWAPVLLCPMFYHTLPYYTQYSVV